MKEESKFTKVAHFDGESVTIKKYDTSILSPENAFKPHPPIKPLTNNGIIGTDDREILKNFFTYPNSTICWLFSIFPDGTEDQQVGSGVMMGKNTVLTCAHNLYSRKFKTFARDVKIVPAAYSGYLPNPNFTPFGVAFKEDVWISDEYRDSTISNLAASNYDWGVIKLTEALGDSTGFCDPYTTNENLLNRNVISKGYPNPDGTRPIVAYEATGKITKVNPLSYETTIDMEQGQSGSPIFLESNQTNIIGILTAILNDKNANKGIRITPDLYSTLVKIRFEAEGKA